ncbi:nitroreductase [Gilvimarinus sp. DA14]|uniref:nitroreductase family protein n=1 Tax=Gilvimarinus sp. DA14 TaxID=2956798 RepID=UPI0020B708F1|nr:nitroreductase [Gilvimarinus sp. DA14]UTF61362.1 nitroreductase [Gilvimarinus sp. DA14]
MDAITALTQRVSVAKLQEPGPSEEQLAQMLGAAVRAADHGLLRPWRFLLVQGEGRQKLGQVFCEAAVADSPHMSEAAQQKFRNMPLRAPCLLLVIASVQEHPKVPAQEQIISAGAAAQNIINAAYALGLGAMWRTGDMAYNHRVTDALGLGANEELVGYIYLGTPATSPAEPKAPDVASLLQVWPNK